MARYYTIATAALALGVHTKWIDNALSHHRVVGVTQQRQGISRRLTVDGLVVLSIALALRADLGTSLGNALDIAHDLLSGDGSLQTNHAISIRIDLQRLKDRLLSQLEHAVEIAPLPRRGRPPVLTRPPKNTTGRLE